MNDQLISEAVQILNRPGSVIIVPTETVYGLVCDWEDTAARERIYQLKGRSESKPLAMFADSPDMAQKFGVKINSEAAVLLRCFAPGPITVIAPANEIYPTVGVRIPDYDFILELLKRRQRPLASTSANASGMPNALTCAEAISQLHGQVDMVINGGTLPSNAMASTVVTACESPCRILRQGPITAEMISAALHQ